MWSKQLFLLLLLCNFSHLLARTSRRLCLVLTVFCERLAQSTQSCSRCLWGHGLFMGYSGRGADTVPVCGSHASQCDRAGCLRSATTTTKTVPEVYYNSKCFLMSNNEVKQFIRLLWRFYTCKHHWLFYWIKHGRPLWALKLTRHAKSQMDWVQLLQPLRGNKTTMSNDLSVNQPALPLRLLGFYCLTGRLSSPLTTVMFGHGSTNTVFLWLTFIHFIQTSCLIEL